MRAPACAWERVRVHGANVGEAWAEVKSPVFGEGVGGRQQPGSCFHQTFNNHRVDDDDRSSQTLAFSHPGNFGNLRSSTLVHHAQFGG